MGEIYFIFFIFFLIYLIASKSFIMLISFFFLISFFCSLIISWFITGWLGLISFLIFIGGILVFLFYLGIFGNYYSLNKNIFIVFFLYIFGFSFSFLSKKLIFRFGNSSDFFFSWVFFFLVSSFLFFFLVVVRKIKGFGRSLRRFS